MRRAGKVDITQKEIVKALRDIGASVQILSAVGQGCPDLLVGWHGRNFALEVKSRQRKSEAAALNDLTSAQREWMANWNGHVAVVRTPEEAQCAVIHG